MPIPIWAALMAATVAKDELIDKPQQRQQNLLRANDQRLSPFLANKEVTPFAQNKVGNNLLQSAFSGLALEQSINAASAQDKLRESTNKLIEARTKALSRGDAVNLDSSFLDNVIGGNFTKQPAQNFTPERFFTPERRLPIRRQSGGSDFDGL